MAAGLVGRRAEGKATACVAPQRGPRPAPGGLVRTPGLAAQSRQTASTQNGHSQLQQSPDSGWGRGWGGRERREGTSVPASTTVELERNNNTKGHHPHPDTRRFRVLVHLIVTVTLDADVNNPFKDVAGDYRDETRTKTQVSSTPESAFQVLTLY